jgi:hypothetical protein
MRGGWNRPVARGSTSLPALNQSNKDCPSMRQPLHYHVLINYSTGALLREIFLTLYRAEYEFCMFSYNGVCNERAAADITHVN